MTDTLEEALNNTIWDAVVHATVARRSGLNTKAADGLVDRLRDHADRMVSPDDAQMLRDMAGKFEQLSTRIKAGSLRPRVKAAARPAPPSPAQLIAQFDAAQLAAAFGHGGPFDVNGHEQAEARRAEIANEQLRARLRRHEEQRARQAARNATPKGAGWS